MQQASKTVAVVVPLSNRVELTPDEEISLKHLLYFLGKYDKFMVLPRSLKIDYPGFGIKRFSHKFFGSPAANDKLMLSPKFYEAFRDYKYILIYHLDALVFSDQLMEWCKKDLDNVGAPWIPCNDSPWVKVPRVGNSGFCLRKVESCLKVINSPRYSVDPTKYWEDFCAGKPKYIRYLNLPRKYLKRLRFFNSVKWEISRSQLNAGQNGYGDDLFWADRAVNYYPKFRVASFAEGLRFAFEVAPRLCFELNGRRLPFGCHAWRRYDRDFWEPYLLK